MSMEEKLRLEALRLAVAIGQPDQRLAFYKFLIGDEDAPCERTRTTRGADHVS